MLGLCPDDCDDFEDLAYSELTAEFSDFYFRDTTGVYRGDPSSVQFLNYRENEIER